MPKGKLVECILASAYLPFFKLEKIEQLMTLGTCFVYIFFSLNITIQTFSF